MANVEVISTFEDVPLTEEDSVNNTQRVLNALKTNPTGHALNAVENNLRLLHRCRARAI